MSRTFKDYPYHVVQFPGGSLISYVYPCGETYEMAEGSHKSKEW